MGKSTVLLLELILKEGLQISCVVELEGLVLSPVEVTCWEREGLGVTWEELLLAWFGIDTAVCSRLICTLPPTARTKGDKKKERHNMFFFPDETRTISCNRVWGALHC